MPLRGVNVHIHGGSTNGFFLRKSDYFNSIIFRYFIIISCMNIMKHVHLFRYQDVSFANNYVYSLVMNLVFTN